MTDVRLIGYGHPDRVWSTVLIKEFLCAVTSLLTENAYGTPVIQRLENDRGFDAYAISSTTTVTLKMKSDKRTFTINVHCVDDFHPDAIANLAIGYFGASNIVSVDKDADVELLPLDDEDWPTSRLRIVFDDKLQWKLERTN